MFGWLRQQGSPHPPRSLLATRQAPASGKGYRPADATGCAPTALLWWLDEPSATVDILCAHECESTRQWKQDVSCAWGWDPSTLGQAQDDDDGSSVIGRARVSLSEMPPHDKWVMDDWVTLWTQGHGARQPRASGRVRLLISWQLEG